MINGQVIAGTLTNAVGSISNTSHQGGWYEFSYDVTTNVVPGANTNVLEVTVQEASANSSVNSAERRGDYWNFSGIFRPVYLMAKPQSNIERLTADAQASGLMNLNIFLSGVTNNCSVVATVTDTNNVRLGEPFTNSIKAGATNILLSATMPSPELWSSEFPNLYTLTVQLRDANNVTLHVLTNLIGFRTVTFSNGLGYFINGKKVLLRGVCRHEFWPTDGRTTSRAESDLDISLIKDMNFNAVRMTHYPPDKIFLEECDRRGLYIFDELGGWHHAYDNTIAPKLIREMLVRDVNHPCIIAWDNGNEGGWNTNVDHDSPTSTNFYALWDPQNRHVNRPGNDAEFSHVYDKHYAPYSNWVAHAAGGEPVFLSTEMNHGLYDGGGGAGLADYWNFLRASTNGAGMFLWAFLDEGAVRDDLGGAVDVQGQRAPDGIVGPFRQPEASYYAYKAIYNPVQIIGPIPGAPFNGTLAVENRFSFTSLNQCKFNWQLGHFPDVSDPANSSSTNALTGGFLPALNSENFFGPKIKPDLNGLLVLPGFPVNATNYDALRLTATDPFGKNLYTWTWPLRTPAQIGDRLIAKIYAPTTAISAMTNAMEIILTNGRREFHFSKSTGVINSVTVSNQIVSLSNGPREVAGTAWPVNGITNYFDGANYIIRMNGLADDNGFQWTLRPDGWLMLTYHYTLTGPQNFMGITFDYPSNKVAGMTWLGQGPYRVYKNRIAGQEVFVHAKSFNNTWTGQGVLIASNMTSYVYPEFAGYHGQLNWVRLKTTEQPIIIVTSTPNLFFRILTPPLTDNKIVNPAYPPGEISLLHGIAPQGEKFNTTSNYGPDAAKNVGTGLYSGEADFFFGLPPDGNKRAL